jgi:glycosyltransferase involved in cell wall biosynthesis
LLASLPCRDTVRLIHSVPDQMLRALYSHAAAVVFPSLAEGLGLPPIQAAACGVPMVVSDLPVLRRIVGEVAFFARPGDPESLCDGLIRVTSDTRAQVTAARLGPQIAARYSPEQFASDHVGVYWSCHETRHALA